MTIDTDQESTKCETKESPSLFHRMCEQEFRQQEFDKFYGYLDKTDSDKARELMEFSL
jgi:hypothetical protein